jgi:hypothetical protein
MKQITVTVKSLVGTKAEIRKGTKKKTHTLQGRAREQAALSTHVSLVLAMSALCV